MRTRPRHVSVWMNEAEYRHLKEPPGEYTQLLRELSAIGNNINQIAYWANAQKSIHEAEIVDAAVLARKAWELVKNGL